MKHKDLKKCAVCKKGMMHSSNPLFYRIKFQRYAVDLGAVTRQCGRELSMGNHILANVMGPNEDMAKPLGKEVEIMICHDCAIK